MANEIKIKRKITLSPTPSPLAGEGGVRGVGIIGLGRMGMQIARRLHKQGFRVVAWNRSEGPRKKLEKFFKNSPFSPSFPLLQFLPPGSRRYVGAGGGGKVGGKKRERGGVRSHTVDSVLKLVENLKRPRLLWLMLPASETDKFVSELSKLLSKGDIIIDGGNSYYQDSIRRANKLARYGIHFLDCGTSGGVWGKRNGFSLMVGGSKKVFKKVEPIFKALAASSSPPSPGPFLSPPARGGDEEGVGEERSKKKHYGLVGPSGTGHFVKMVHNGIEYGMMEAIAEGFAVINKHNPKINLAEVARIWEKGSVVSSWLISLARDIFEKEDLSKIAGYIHHTGEGEWTIKTAKKLGVDVRVIEDAFKVRLESGKKKNQKKISNKIVSLLRNRFGGHEVTRKL